MNRRGGRWPGADSGVWNEWWRSPPPRVERGVVRWLLLDAIASQPRHGYEIIQFVGEKSGGAYRPSPGVVYPTLQMLEELGHAHTVVRGERKIYEITDDGRKELASHVDEVREFYEGSDAGWSHHTDDVAHLMKRVGRVVWLFKRAMHRGAIRPATMRKARVVLDDALAKLEELLSPEEL